MEFKHQGRGAGILYAAGEKRSLKVNKNIH